MENKAQASGGQKTVAIERELELPIAKVWSAWTEAESFKKWWGPYDYTCPYCRIDPHEGGKYLASMKGPDGNEIYSGGIFQEIIPNRKLVMTDNFTNSEGEVVPAPAGLKGDWSARPLITIEFEEHGDRTLMKLRHEGIPTEMHDDCITGWNQSIDKMEGKMK